MAMAGGARIGKVTHLRGSMYPIDLGLAGARSLLLNQLSPRDEIW